MTDVATIDALMAQPWAEGIRREQMGRIWERFLDDVTEWLHEHALAIITGKEERPPYTDLFNAALERIIKGDVLREAEATRIAEATIRAGDAKWAKITRESSGLRRASLT